MIVKWVRCETADAAAFDRGQRGWSGLSGLPGFRGQFGGWSRGAAHVFAFWDTERDHARFMAGEHDRIAAGQAGTYNGIEVRVWQAHLDIGAGLPTEVPPGSVVRLAHCHVKPGHANHFVEVQATVWNPGMEAADGMRGGVFARRGDSDFLVLSLWNSPADHERYVGERFPGLRVRSCAADDLDKINGELVQLVPEWTVPR